MTADFKLEAFDIAPAWKNQSVFGFGWLHFQTPKRVPCVQPIVHTYNQSQNINLNRKPA